MRTEIVFRRNGNSNITVPWAVTRDGRGTVFGQPLGRNNCGCQGVSASPTVMRTLLRSCPQRSTPHFFQSCRKAHRVLDGRPEPLQQYQVTSLAVASESQPGKTTLCTKSERDENRSVGSPGSPIRTFPGRRYSPGVSCGTVCGETLGLESGGTEEIEDARECPRDHAAEVAPARPTHVSPKLSEEPLNVG